MNFPIDKIIEKKNRRKDWKDKKTAGGTERKIVQEWQRKEINKIS